MFYCDDDTVVMAEAALKLASEFDHRLPYLITDNFWWSEQFGLATHPRSKVCSFDLITCQ